MTPYLQNLARMLYGRDQVAERTIKILSIGEYLWVAMAACRTDLLAQTSYPNLDQAWRRLDPAWRAAVTRFWESLG